MGLFSSVKSLAEGVVYLFRWSGLRYHLIRVEQRIAELERFIQETAREKGDLREYEQSVSSQNGEDGILEEIFRRIGPGGRYFVEFGVQSGTECNCAHLVRSADWRGLFMELDQADHRALTENYRKYDQVQCVQACVTSDNIEELFEKHDVPRDLDLLSIDIDSNDYWVWQAVENWKPRVVVIEYNAHYRPPVRWVMKENQDFRWDGSTYYGASLASLAALGREKGYTLVGTESTGVNAFFVRDDQLTDEFVQRSVAYHYSSPRFGMHELGHPVGDGPAVTE